MRRLVVACALVGCGDNTKLAPDAASPDAPIVSGTSLFLRPVTTIEGTITLVTSPPADDRLFVVQDLGKIWIIDHGVTLPEPFLDVTSGISPPYYGGSGREVGLLGLEFHPDFATNRTFFINYTASNTGDPANPFLDVTMRMQVSATDPTKADPSTAQVVVAIPDFAENHNGGMLQFGPDGYLYISTGDGGIADDPHRNGQDAHALLAKILRVDVDHGAPYAIPPDNPFADGVAGAPEVYILGLRNPWRFGFDRATGDLYIGDVGQNTIEELDVLHPDEQRGANLGWSMYEGNNCFHAPCDPTGLVFPKDTREHGDGWCAIIGGDVYRGALYPDLVGEYYYTDYCRGGLTRARLVGDALEVVDLTNILPVNPSTIHAVASGELYAADLYGNIYHLEAAR
jgi:glucose/arabinose dehydrogenase